MRGRETSRASQALIWATTLVALVVSSPDVMLFWWFLFGPIGAFGPLLIDLTAIGLGVGLSRRVEPGTAGRWVAGGWPVSGWSAVSSPSACGWSGTGKRKPTAGWVPPRCEPSSSHRRRRVDHPPWIASVRPA